LDWQLNSHGPLPSIEYFRCGQDKPIKIEESNAEDHGSLIANPSRYAKGIDNTHPKKEGNRKTTSLSPKIQTKNFEKKSKSVC
jgi:hypothetical protein